MAFNSINFIIFFLAISFLYYVMPKKIQWIFLLIISLFFYLYAGPKFIIFIFMTTITTFYCAKLMWKIDNNSNALNKSKNLIDTHVKSQKNLILAVTLVINLGVLIFLKYYNLFVQVGNSLLILWNISSKFPSFILLLPLGISFYTLQAIGYCLDVYRSKYEPERNIAKYALFLLFFPQILQGPIGRFDSLANQLYVDRTFDYDNVKFGFQLMVWGFFKKLVVADRVGILVNQVFNHYKNYSGYQILVASIFYSIQIYADFSGCMDIARGGAQVLGINIIQNFNRPYFAKSIQDFWRRWHISLSSWLRDYLYIPLGGNRKGIVRKYINILIVFFISGIWHGVGIHYLVWGLLHGIYQVIGILLMPIRNFLVKTFKINRQSFSHKLYKVTVTFSLVNFAWIFFRAENLKVALYMVRAMLSSIIHKVPVHNLFYSMGLNASSFRIAVISTFVMFVVSILQSKIHVRETISKQSFPFRWIFYFVSVCSVLVLGLYGYTSAPSPFIYYKF